jgi:hypothetical protein
VVSLVIDPGIVGTNDIHLYVTEPSGLPVEVEEATVGGFYQWLDDNGIGAGKPRMLAEYGTTFDPADATRKQEWFEALPRVVEDHPLVKAVVYFNSAGITTTSPTCNMRMDDTPASIAGFSTAGDDPYFNQPH